MVQYEFLIAQIDHFRMKMNFSLKKIELKFRQPLNFLNNRDFMANSSLDYGINFLNIL